MKIKADLLIFRFSIWITAELYLGYLGLDNLADYSEYLGERNASQIVSRERLYSSL